MDIPDDVFLQIVLSLDYATLLEFKKTCGRFLDLVKTNWKWIWPRVFRNIRYESGANSFCCSSAWSWNNYYFNHYERYAKLGLPREPTRHDILNYLSKMDEFTVKIPSERLNAIRWDMALTRVELVGEYEKGLELQFNGLKLMSFRNGVVDFFEPLLLFALPYTELHFNRPFTGELIVTGVCIGVLRDRPYIDFIGRNSFWALESGTWWLFCEGLAGVPRLPSKTENAGTKLIQ